MVQIKSQKQQIYFVVFEDYLQPPRKPHKKDNLLLIDENIKRKPELRLILLEHPVFVSANKSTIWQRCRLFLRNFYYAKLAKFQHPKKRNLTIKEKKEDPVNNKLNILNNGSIYKIYKSLRNHFHLPGFLAFLLARNDDGLCKRKTGFEIYCEMASIHGFVNFVGAKTWQRILWCLVIFIAILMSTIFLVMWHLMNVNTPTILYTESSTYPAWTIPFPAVTICNFNRISYRNAFTFAQKFNFSNANMSMSRYFRLQLYNSFVLDAPQEDFEFMQTFIENNELNLLKLQRNLSPNCESELLRCKWKGKRERCDKLFRKVETTQGICCSFNLFALKERKTGDQRKYAHYFFDEPEHTTSSGYKTGLTVLLDAHTKDYLISSVKKTGYQVLIHDAYEFPSSSIQRYALQDRTENMLSIKPRSTYATEYLNTEKLHVRRCYLPNERQLHTFRAYTQINCLLECRSQKLFHKCGCIPPMYIPENKFWPSCSFKERKCINVNKNIFSSVLVNKSTNYKTNHYTEKYICDCYPACNFNLYGTSKHYGQLNEYFSQTENRFFNFSNANTSMSRYFRLRLYNNCIAK
ncbi:pickpocket protein 11-like isoform X2 [Teleopsis dalmanni]|uniref:pickpocket protein 11-like isoform X2 n=1 Tax=Teleopsis dalmanni TaxID=139649 RepID=UPI0018CEFD04|nr:pickpocket protein 11-like isoform X2 [Teleopsis dalmanni]